MYSPCPEIVILSLHILHVQFTSVRYFRLGEKCLAWSVRLCPTRTFASCLSCWYLRFSSQALRSPNSTFPIPFIPHAGAIVIQCTVGRLLLVTYVPTPYQCFHPNVIIKLTTYGPKFCTTSTPHPYAYLHTMVFPYRCGLSASLAQTV